IEPFDNLQRRPLRKCLNGRALALLTIPVRADVGGGRSAHIRNDFPPSFSSAFHYFSLKFVQHSGELCTLACYSRQQGQPQDPLGSCFVLILIDASSTAGGLPLRARPAALRSM